MGSKISFVSLFALGALFISGCEINVNTTSTIKPGTIDLIAPSISSFKVPATSSSLVVGPIEIIAADNVAVGGYVLSDSNVVPLVSAGLFNSVAPTSFTFSSAGQKNLYAFVVDTSGNVSPVASASVVISLVADTVAPVVNTFSLPATSTTLSVPIISLAATDANGIAGYFLSESSTKPAANVAGWASSFASYNFSSTGSKNLYAFAKDPAGNVSVGKLASVNISAPADTVAPVVSLFNLAGTGSSLTVCGISGSASDNVGVTGFALSESSVAPAIATFTSSVPTCFTFGSAGSKTLYLFAKDAAGNIGSKSAQITITLQGQFTATLAPIADTYISNSDVHSAEARLHTYTWPNDTSANAILMKFDLSSIPQNAVIDNAVLKMYLVEADSAVAPAEDVSIYTLSIHAIVNKNVDVNKATGVTYDGSNPWTAPMALSDISAQAATMPIDKVLGIKSVAIPQLVQNMVSNPGSNFGMLLNSDAGVVQDRYRYFASLEDASGDPARKPSLVVTYHTGPSADTSAPVVTFSMASTASSLVVPVSFTASDNVGVTGYLLKETSSIPLASDSRFAAAAQPSYTFASAGSKTLYAFAKDAAGNVSTVKSASVTITLPVVVTESLFTSSTVPGAKENDGTPYEMGMRFRSASSGQISAIRFYRVAEDTGVHVGSIFSTNGSKLASVTFSGESASVGWQSQALPSPVSIQANVDYVVSVTSPTGNYGYTEYAFNSPITRGNLTGLGSLFGPSDGSIPDQTWVGHAANYFRDIVFTEGYVPPVPTGSAILSWTPPTDYTDGNPMPAGTVTGYKISYRSGSSTPTVVTVSGGSTSTYTINNLPLGSTYYFSVLATSNAGDGASTAEVPKSL